MRERPDYIEEAMKMCFSFYVAHPSHFSRLLCVFLLFFNHFNAKFKFCDQVSKPLRTLDHYDNWGAIRLTFGDSHIVKRYKYYIMSERDDATSKIRKKRALIVHTYFSERSSRYLILTWWSLHVHVPFMAVSRCTKINGWLLKAYFRVEYYFEQSVWFPITNILHILILIDFI